MTTTPSIRTAVTAVVDADTLTIAGGADIRAGQVLRLADGGVNQYAVVASTVAARAQEERAAGKDTGSVAPVATPTHPWSGHAAGLRRDPFATTEKMRARAERRDEPGPAFVPTAAQAPVPHLVLRGYVEPRGRPAAALLEVDGQGVYVVRAGDTIGITLSGRNTVLRVVAVEAQGARIEAGSYGQVIVIR